jgi:hypothetical protein
MFEEDFFEAEELQPASTKTAGNSEELMVDISRYVRALK